MAASWLTCLRPRPAAALRLICLPHAGGGSVAFHPLAALLPPSIEMMAVQLPGRETRLTEAPHDRMAPLVDAMLVGIRASLSKPYVLFGHSMGALVAFEFSRALRRQDLPLPRMIVVSGRQPPTEPNIDPSLHLLPDAAFVEALVARYSAIPRSILDAPDLMALFVPALKADFAVFETHVHREEPPLGCAVAIYGGQSDPQTRRMAGWAKLFTGPSRIRVFDGGHFYLVDQRRAVAAALIEDMLEPFPAVSF